MKKNIILIAGDPNSINSEIIYKSWKKIDKSQKKKSLPNWKFRFNEITIEKVELSFKT